MLNWRIFIFAHSALSLFRPQVLYPPSNFWYDRKEVMEGGGGLVGWYLVGIDRRQFNQTAVTFQVHTFQFGKGKKISSFILSDFLLFIFWYQKNSTYLSSCPCRI